MLETGVEIVSVVVYFTNYRNFKILPPNLSYDSATSRYLTVFFFWTYLHFQNLYHVPHNHQQQRLHFKIIKERYIIDDGIINMRDNNAIPECVYVEVTLGFYIYKIRTNFPLSWCTCKPPDSDLKPIYLNISWQMKSNMQFSLPQVMVLF